MSNPVITAAKLNRKRSALELKEQELKDAQERSEALIRAIDDDTTDEEVEEVEKSVDEIQEAIRIKEEEKTNLEKEIEELEAALEESNEKAPKQNEELEGRESKMNNEDKEFREGIKNYVRSKGQERAGFTTVEGGALIPDGKVTTPKEAKETVVDLRDLVNKVPVTTPAGSYPVLAASKAVMVSVAELALNPELAKPTFTDVDYKVDTYRGYIPVSQEVIDDATYNVEGLIAKHIERLALNTANKEIAKEMKSFSPKTISGLDDLKTILNVAIEPAYNSKLVLSQSLFNVIDQLKDGNGQYLLQQDITVNSGYKLMGREVVVLADTIIGEKPGDAVGFIGDLDSGITYFDRKQTTVKWTDNDVYGQLLAGFVRFDVKKADPAAGYYITYVDDSAAGA